MTSQNGSLLQSVFRLTFVMSVGWVLCFWPARLLSPEYGVKWMSIAAICCLVPGWIVVLLERLAIFRGDKLIFGQMVVRFLALLIATVAVKLLRPELGLVEFYGWLVLFYLLAMIYEVVLLSRKMAEQSKSPPAGSANSGDAP